MIEQYHCGVITVETHCETNHQTDSMNMICIIQL